MNGSIETRYFESGQLLELADDVFLARASDEPRIVDLTRGRFYAIDQVGSRMLEIALQEGSAKVAEKIASNYRVPIETAERDWRELLGGLAAQRLIRRRGARHRARDPRGGVAPRRRRRINNVIPSRFCLGLLMTACWLSLRLFGWARTIRWLQRHHNERVGSEDLDNNPPVVDAVDESVRDVAAGHILNPECKERAIVAWHLLRGRHQLPARLIVGIRTYPFRAHAWVECGSQYVSDDQRLCRLYTPIASYE